MPLLALAVIYVSILMGHSDTPPFDLDRRVLWTNSHVVGSPDPPLPYTTQAVFTNLTWKSPLYMAAEPGHDTLLVVLQGGEKERPSKILRLSDDLYTDKTETVFTQEDYLIYGLTFHPGYLTNHYLYLFLHTTTGGSSKTNRVSRFVVERDPPRSILPDSEKIIIEWPSNGHDGGDLVFGRDGMLYITTGDGTSDSDGLVTGQDLTDLAGGVVRIDVDPPTSEQAYAVPRDNPFLDLPGARPELWAYGLRNPWRMCIDAKTGHIWVGNNGQDLWETAHLIGRGENYGWSVYEGSHPFYLNRPRGPTPPVAPTIEHSHADFRSLTGGVVYYGASLPDLNGAYVYGDYSTGKIWGGRHDGKRLVWHRELADTTLQIVAFTATHRGDLLIADHGGNIHRLIPNPPQPGRSPFPTLLSQTGLFLDTTMHRPEPGLIPYGVIAPGWTDGAEAERFIGLPGDSKARYSGSGGWELPEGAVVMQTFFIPSTPTGTVTALPARRRIETRLLTRQQSQWAAYSYRWNAQQTDATLVESGGQTVAWPEPNAPSTHGLGSRTWKFPSRAECLACHSRAVNYLLGLTSLQMNRDHDYGATRTNQLRALSRLGALSGVPESIAKLHHLTDPYDTTQELEARARSYLHANCSGCHVEAGGGNAQMELGFDTKRERMRLFETRPQHDTFGIDNAMLVWPGDAARSVLYQRVSRRGPGQMPPLVSLQVDASAAQLFHDWIQNMKSERKFVREWTMNDLQPKLAELESKRSLAAGRDAFRDAGCQQCHRLAGQGGSVGPALTGTGRKLGTVQLLESILDPSKSIAPEYAMTEIETASGESLSGHVEREDETTVVLGPKDAFSQPLSIPKKTILSRRLSTVSNMPTGLLNSLEASQILDLLAYLTADGSGDF